jgi:hypothetical protein
MFRQSPRACSQAIYFALSGNHHDVFQAHLANYSGTYLLVPSPKNEALTADWRDDYLSGFSMNRLKDLFFVYILC